MITNNFKNIAAMLLQARNSISAPGNLPAKNTAGTDYYLTGYFTASGLYPYAITTYLERNATAAGISVGTGSTAAAANDYALEAPITSGISGNVVIQTGMDDGAPYVQYDVTINNTNADAITIREIGFKQSARGSTTQGGTNSSNQVFLLDRTVLDTPVTIAAGGYGIVRYTLKTVVGD